MHARLGGAGHVDDFIIENIEHPRRRRTRILELEADANPFDWPHAAVIGV